jgi:formate dehydrogenase major subunit
MAGPDPPATVCPLCAVGCRLTRGPETRASGRAGPANPNGRLCPKGIGAFERFEGTDRLSEPIVRDGNELHPVSWETAYRRVVDGIEAVVDDAGSDALAFFGAPHCTNEENYLLAKLARSLGTNNVDNRARHCHTSTTQVLDERLGWPATTNSLDDVGESDVLLIVGANPAKRQPVAFDAHVRPAVNDGTTLVHLDPVGNDTTRLADIHLSPVPGTDALLLNRLCVDVIDDDNVDTTFLRERTTGFESVAAELEAFDREEARERTDVASGTLDRVSSLIAEADHVAAIVGTGAEDEADETAHALLNLLLLTGNVGRPGTGLYVFRGPPNEQGAIDAGCVPDRLPGHQPIDDSGARARIADEWGIDPPSEPGTTVTEALESFGEEIRAVVAVGENPAIAKYDSEWVDDRLDALDLLVVLEVRESRTTRHADVVLPAATGLEKAGTMTNLDRQVQRLRPVSSPPGQARPDRTIVCDVAKRLQSVETCFEYSDPAAVFDEMARVAPTYAGLEDDLDDGRRWPGGTAVLYRETFETADGRARFAVPTAITAPTSGEGLTLVAGGRASGRSGKRRDDEGGTRARLHPSDARLRGVRSDDQITLSDGEVTVTAIADLDESVRQGAVFLHANHADPLLRAGTTNVTVRSRTPNDVRE